jgi:protein-tyrosine-phosphatase
MWAMADHDADANGTSVQPFRILFVCTANVCRSPMAEHLMRRALEQRPGHLRTPWAVGSAGTRALVGADMDPSARHALRERGVDAPLRRARQLTTAEIDVADLVLTASRTERSSIVALVPSSTRRVFTLRQFGRLCAAGREVVTLAGPPAGADLMELATAGRGRVQPVDPARDEVRDPFGQELDAFRTCARVIERTLDRVLGPA